MYILGINAYHGGASASLIHNGQLIAAAEEDHLCGSQCLVSISRAASNFVCDDSA